ncbi:hypothetical protein SK128_006914 [Halocaridina rubra]|uniref:Uncharacterized protein n=1 Tax=Halocaridina rubra TaxID=373956 RepID=A0AAN9FU38_HALRR
MWLRGIGGTRRWKEVARQRYWLPLVPQFHYLRSGTCVVKVSTGVFSSPVGTHRRNPAHEPACKLSHVVNGYSENNFLLPRKAKKNTTTAIGAQGKTATSVKETGYRL